MTVLLRAFREAKDLTATFRLPFISRKEGRNYEAGASRGRELVSDEKKVQQARTHALKCLIVSQGAIHGGNCVLKNILTVHAQ